MATASVAVTEVPVTTYETQRIVTLELSATEAKVLLVLVGKVGGSGKARDTINSVYHELDHALGNGPFDYAELPDNERFEGNFMLVKDEPPF